MDFLTNIVYTLLAYSPELLLTYVIVAAIIGMIKRVRRGLRDDGSFIRLLASRLDGNGQKDDDDELARDPYTAVNLLNGYTQGVTPTLDADAAPLPPESLRTPAPLPPGFVRLDQEAVPTAGVLDATLSAPSQPSSLPPTNAKHVTAITLGSGSSVAAMLRNLPSEYHVVDDVVIADTAGTSTVHATTTTLDHVVVSPYGVFVIDEKETVEQRIEGDVQEPRWRACWGDGRDPSRPDTELFNPIMENIRHVQALGHITGIPAEQFISIIVFCGTDVDLEGISGRKKLLSSTRGMPYPTRIITEDQLEDVFNAYRKPSMNEFIVQAKSATIASLSMVETHGAPEI